MNFPTHIFKTVTMQSAVNIRRWLFLGFRIAISCFIASSIITFSMPVFGSPPVTPVPALAEKDIPSLAEQLKNRSRQDRVNALLKLKQYTLPSNSVSLISPVVELFQHDPDQGIRIQAANVLERLFRLKQYGLPSNSAYIGTVLEVFQHDPEQNIRIEAAKLLTLDLPFTAESAKSLFAVLNDKDEHLRQLVANCIPVEKKYMSEMLAALKNDDPMVRKAFIYKLGVCSPNQDSLIRTALVNALKDPNSSVALAAARELQKAGADILEANQLVDKHITAGLSNPDKSVRQATLIELLPYKSINPKYTDLFIKLLDDRDEGNRQFAAEALTRVGPAGKAAIPILVRSLVSNSPGGNWMYTATVLAKLGSHEPDVLESLTGIMRSGGPASAGAAKSLEAFGKYSVPYLIKGLHDKNRYGQGLALGALYNIGKEASAAVPDLLAIWNPNDLYVPQVLCGQLPPYDLSPRWAVIDTLISIAPDDKRVVYALEPIALDKSNIRQQTAAIHALKKIGTKDALDIIK